MPRPRVLIAGASIAGPALAFWLGRSGWDVTVVERAPAFRDGGQNVDVRGAGREVLRRAGLEQAVRDATTGERGTRFVDDGRAHDRGVPGRRVRHRWRDRRGGGAARRPRTHPRRRHR